MIESIIQNNRIDFVNGRPIIYNLLKSKMEFRKEDAENVMEMVFVVMINQNLI